MFFNIILLQWSKTKTLCKHNTLLFVAREITEIHCNITMFMHQQRFCKTEQLQPKAIWLLWKTFMKLQDPLDL